MNRLRCATYLAPKIMPLYHVITHEIARLLGIDIEFVVATDYDSCRSGENDLCFVCSLPYITFEREGLAVAEPIAAPVLIGERYQGKPIYFSDVIVREDSDIHSFEDLRNHSWSFNEPLSQSGYGITRYHLLQLGETNGFFSDVVQAGYHDESMRLVAAGEVDASAIDSQDLAVAFKQYPDFKRSVRIIDSLGPSSIQPIAVSKRLTPLLRSQIQDIILHLHLNPVMQELFAYGEVSHFVKVEASTYDDIRNMLTTCEQADFMTIK